MRALCRHREAEWTGALGRDRACDSEGGWRLQLRVLWLSGSRTCRRPASSGCGLIDSRTRSICLRRHLPPTAQTQTGTCLGGTRTLFGAHFFQTFRSIRAFPYAGNVFPVLENLHVSDRQMSFLLSQDVVAALTNF